MTNAQIVLAERFRLMADGKIGTTGRMLEGTDMDGKMVYTPEPEEIHTFAAWKNRGYKVRKGEKAVARILIWKYANREVENEDGEVEDRSRMFMKTAAFFSQSQVEELAA